RLWKASFVMEAMHKKARGAGKACPGWIERKNPAGQAGFFHDTEKNQLTLVTSAAWGPFCPCTTSNSTLSPSASDLKPLPPIALKWTKTSGPPSREMNPNPLASLNHLTVPVMRAIELILVPHRAICKAATIGKRQRAHLPLRRIFVRVTHYHSGKRTGGQVLCKRPLVYAATATLCAVRQ